MIQSRRSFLIGASASLLAAPAIVKISSIMPVKSLSSKEAIEALLAARIENTEVAMRAWMSAAVYGNGAVQHFGGLSSLISPDEWVSDGIDLA